MNNPFTAMRARYSAAHPVKPSAIAALSQPSPIPQIFRPIAKTTQPVGVAVTNALPPSAHQIWYEQGKQEPSLAAAQADIPKIVENPVEVARTIDPTMHMMGQMNTPNFYATESNVAKTAPVLIPAPQEILVSTAPVTVIAPASTVAPKETVAQDIGNFFKKMQADINKGFSFILKIDQEAQPIITGVEQAIAPFDAPLSAQLALGDTLVSGVLQTIGNVINTITAAGQTTLTPAVVASTAKQVEAQILSDPTLQKALAAVGGTPTNLTKFNTALSAIAAAAIDLTTAI